MAMSATAPNILNQTVYVDIAKGEVEARESLKIAYDKLTARDKKLGGLSTADAIELNRLENLKKLADAGNGYFDPLFVALRDALNRGDGNLVPIDVNHSAGKLTFKPNLVDDDFNKQATRVALIYGFLKKDETLTPPVLAGDGDTRPDRKHPNMAKFTRAFYEALGIAAGQMDLAQKVLSFQIQNMRIKGQAPAAYAGKFAEAVAVLAKNGVDEDDPRLKVLADAAFKKVTDLDEGDVDERPWHEVAINLPDLNAFVDNNVVEENVYLMGPMIFASMFEELKAFQVVDKLIEMSQRGHLSLARGAAGTQIYEYWRQAPSRMSEVERQTFYAMTLGMPTGQPGAQVNSDFQDLWLRFVSSVSSLVRENRVDQLIRSSLPVAINQQQVKKSARDLVSNMSLHGYGMAYYAAIDLQKQINEMITLLSDPELRAAFGARDMWGVIDQIAQVELGGARNSSKYRTLATSGAIITRWLGDNLVRMRDPTLPMIDLKDVENPPARMTGQTATTDPTDYDLVNACELWLADSALDDLRIEELSQPRESPQQPSRPIQMPSIARDLLEGTGLGLGMGYQQPQAVNGHDRRAYAGY